MKKVFLFATLAVATVFNLGYIAYGKYNAMSQADKLVFDNIEALSGGEDYNPYCHNGGPGSISCSIEGGINVAGYGVSAKCSVSCSSGYYACCGLRCTCKKS